MRITGADGCSLELRIAGYQFPEAEDPDLRFSWHVITGTVSAKDESWDFGWQALTCDESGELSNWLRLVANFADAHVDPSAVDFAPEALMFTEPNLAFSYARQRGSPAEICVNLDAEFRPPRLSSVSQGCVSPYTLCLDMEPSMLRQAADEWDRDLARFPDGHLD